MVPPPHKKMSMQVASLHWYSLTPILPLSHKAWMQECVHAGALKGACWLRGGPLCRPWAHLPRRLQAVALCATSEHRGGSEQLKEALLRGTRA